MNPDETEVEGLLIKKEGPGDKMFLVTKESFQTVGFEVEEIEKLVVLASGLLPSLEVAEKKQSDEFAIAGF